MVVVCGWVAALFRDLFFLLDNGVTSVLISYLTLCAGGCFFVSASGVRCRRVYRVFYKQVSYEERGRLR
jgi:hypothetical protein